MNAVAPNRSRALVVAALLAGAALAAAQEVKPLPLPAPRMEGGRPLLQVLKERASAREFRPDPLPPQVLSDLLWAAFGVNRPDSGHRTAPSARNWQEIDVYVAKADGLFLYEAAAHALRPLLTADIRAKTGTQPFVGETAVNLVYVADLKRTGKTAPEDRDLYVAADTGFIAQNVYLFCASEGLATVVRGSVDRPALAKAMKLRPDQKIILAQSVGYPKN